MSYTIEIQAFAYTVRYCPDSRGFGPIIGIGRTQSIASFASPVRVIDSALAGRGQLAHRNRRHEN